MRDRMSVRLRRGGSRAKTVVLAHKWPVAGIALALSLTLAVPGSALARTSGSAPAPAAYLNPQLPVQARVNNLLGRMTLPEKIGQMVQIEVTQVTDTSNTCTSQGGFNMPNP